MNKVVRMFLFGLLVMSLFIVAACGSSDNNAEETAEQPTDTEGDTEEVVELEGQLVVYSSRNENFVQPLLEKFSEETGIEVLPLHGADPLQIEEEAGNVQADIFISNDLGALEYLNSKDFLQGFDPEGVETIDEQFRADDNAWIALSARARGFIYNKDLITEEEMPKSLEDLFDAKWAEVEKGYAITRGGNGGMIGNVSALRHEWGDEKTAEWIEAIKENAAGIFEGHGDIRRAVGAGEYSFGLVNNYYYHQQLEEPTDNNVGFIYTDQGEGEMGVIANAAGLGLIKGAPNEANAKAFIEWILETENQLAFVGESLELPINEELDPPYEAATKFSELKVQDMPLKELGNYFEDTKALIEDAGLDLELK
ncbi:extracellular solute-binding protein [Halalkalibacter krulwichiae]|uniref:Putative binding protein component of ABC iron transporter n=1 Tax=Halalkalibacter krulwichiae TaxID=199441 RepID=A0A1X9MDT7_9BACI|nr:extracellular solute-binding protein [Halalkalibacter krulwichiae]ARK28602.1 putative binding protein component of ABC iron transporter precursor [Halalkalibacter krulwichiae]